MRRSAVVAAVVLALVFVGGQSLLTAPTTTEIVPENGTDPAPEMVRPTDGASGFWPYLNSQPTYQKRSPINVVVVGETEDVVQLLIAAGDSDWQETERDQEEAEPGSHADEIGNVTEGNVSVFGGNGSVSDENDSLSDENGSVSAREETDPGGGESDSGGNAAGVDGDGTETVGNGSEGEEDADEPRIEIGSTEIAWSRTTGATRYAYVDPGNGESGRWVTETAQIHDGTYYGHRYHIRLYESPTPEEPWVAMQTHREHFDWFTLRHRVDGSQRAQARLEQDLMNLPGIDAQQDVRRIYLDNGNRSDGDGWATFVDLVGLLVIGLALGGSTTTGPLSRVVDGIDARLTPEDRRRIAVARDRVDVRHVLLAAWIVAVVLGVRTGGIALEHTGLLSMHAIAALLYPLVALGLPVGAYLVSSGLEQPLDAAVVASGALAVSFWLDYGTLGVTSLPIDVIVWRMVVVGALGLIAGGAARGATRDSRWNALLVAGALSWVFVLGGTLLGYL